MNRAAVLQACFGAVLMLVLVRAAVLFEPFPGWDANPLESISPIVGLGPAGFLTLDTLTLALTGALCLLGGRRLSWIAITCLLGCAGVVTHTWLFARGDAEPLPVAGAWASGAAALAAAAAIRSRPALRRAGIAIVIGFLCILLAKSAGQLLVEHPSVVATFDEDPDAALAARGFQPGSSAALQFERRLRQPDITGWFGLSNVLAAYLAAGAVACCALCWQSRRLARDWAWLAVAALGVMCWLGVYLSGSKAGMAIAAAGTGALAVSHFCRITFGDRSITHLAARASGVLLWLLPLAAICSRALLLPPEGELSLLFRWFYLESAVDIAHTNLPSGTGIDGFRAAYAVVKPPIAPETVTSSHNALADWAAMLGAFAIPLLVTIAAAVWLLAPTLSKPTLRLTGSAPTRPTVLCIGLVLCAPVLAGAALESAAALIELAALRVVGLAFAIAVAAAVWRLKPGTTVATCAALVLLTHSQLDMVLFHPGSIPLTLFAVGLALPNGQNRRWKQWTAAIPAISALAIGVLAANAWQWESSLRRGFTAAQTIAATTERARAGSESARAELPAVARQMLPIIDDGLRSAADAMPRDPRAWLALGDIEIALAGPNEAAWETATKAADIDRSVRTLGRLASLAEAIANSTPDQADREVWIERARENLARAADLDPHGPHFPARRAELEAREHQIPAARVWASRALESDTYYQLDPLARLPDAQRARLQALLAEPAEREDGVKLTPPGS